MMYIIYVQLDEKFYKTNLTSQQNCIFPNFSVATFYLQKGAAAITEDSEEEDDDDIDFDDEDFEGNYSLQ